MSDFVWIFGKKTFTVPILKNPCPICKREGALMGLPPPLLKKQKDGTNIVCNPALGGCNHGFKGKVREVK